MDKCSNGLCVSGAHQLAWLPVSLPEHCKLVVSTLPEYYGILEKLRKMVQLEENYLQVTPLGQNLGICHPNVGHTAAATARVCRRHIDLAYCDVTCSRHVVDRADNSGEVAGEREQAGDAGSVAGCRGGARTMQLPALR